MMVSSRESVPNTTWTDIIFFRVVALHLLDVSEIGTGSGSVVGKFCPPQFAGRPNSIPPVLSGT